MHGPDDGEEDWAMKTVDRNDDDRTMITMSIFVKERRKRTE